MDLFIQSDVHSNPVCAHTADTDFRSSCLEETGSSSIGHSTGLNSLSWCTGPLLASYGIERKPCLLLLLRMPSLEQYLFGGGGGEGRGVLSVGPGF